MQVNLNLFIHITPLKKHLPPFIIVLMALLFSSCSSGLSVRRSQVTYFDKSFSAKVVNRSFKAQGFSHGDPALLYLFEVPEHKHTDTVYVSFNSNSELELTYVMEGQNVTRTFAGTFDKKGYYEFYFSNQKIEIPPILPIFYSNNRISRIRLALSTRGDLIIDKKWDNSGNIFLLGGGSSGRGQSFFKCTAQ